jgi:ABC-type antimicrobial peptide transport system permease subunit
MANLIPSIAAFARLTRYEGRHLLRRRGRAAAIVLGVAIGAALLTVGLGIAATLRSVVAEEAQGLAGNATLVVVPVSGPRTESVNRILRRTGGIRMAVPVVKAATTLKLGASSRRVLLLGVGKGLPSLYADGLGSTGRQILRLQGDAGLIGPGLWNQIGGRAGWLPEGKKGWLHGKEIESTPFADLNSGFFFLTTVHGLRHLVRPRDRSAVFYVQARKGVVPQHLRRKLELALAGRAIVTTPAAVARAYRGPVESLTLFTESGAFASLPISMFVVFSIVSRSMMERRRDLALLITIGASRRRVSASVLAVISLLGCAGGLIGVGVGCLLGGGALGHVVNADPLLPRTQEFELEITPAIVAIVIGMSTVTASVAALLPIWRVTGMGLARAINPASFGAISTQAHRVGWRRTLRAAAFPACAVALLLLLSDGALSQSARIGAFSLLGAMFALLGLPLITALGLRALGRASMKPSRLLFPLAARNVRGNRSRTVLMVGSLSLAAALAGGIGASVSRVEARVSSLFSDRYGPPLYVTAASFSGLSSDRPMEGDIARRLRRQPGVRDVFPFRFRVIDVAGSLTVIVSAPMVREFREGFSNAIVDTRGVSESNITSGLNHGGVVVSQGTAGRHHLRLGERLVLGSLADSFSPRVVGTYEDLLGADAFYLERRTYIQWTGDRSVDRFAIAPKSGVSPRVLKQELNRFIERQGIPAVVETRREVIDGILAGPRRAFDFGQAMAAVFFVIAALIVASAMIAAVRERRWEISMCRVLGMSRWQAAGEVGLQCLIIGALAALCAGALVLGIDAVISYLVETRLGLDLRSGVDWRWLGWGSAAPVVVALGIGVVPAWIAAGNPLLPEVRTL